MHISFHVSYKTDPSAWSHKYHNYINCRSPVSISYIEPFFTTNTMAEKIPQQKNTPIDHISDSKSLEDEVNPRLWTSEEERIYGSIRGSAQATQAALAHSTARSNPMVERGPAHPPKIKPLSKQKAEDKTTQTQTKNKPNWLLEFIIVIWALYTYVHN